MDHNLACSEAILRMRSGDNAAASEVFYRFVHRLLVLAQGRLDPRLRSWLDPEDVVQSVFRTFFRRSAEGQFLLVNWDNVWQVLARITVRKCSRKNSRLVRKTVLIDAANDLALYAASAREPTPEESAVFVETLEELMRELPERERAVFLLRLQGNGTLDIGKKLGCTVRKVQRVLQQIRLRLQHMENTVSDTKVG